MKLSERRIVMATLTPDYKNKFINPYSFIAKTKNVERGSVKYGELTGKVTCILKVKDMLALPDHNASDGKQKFDFFKIDGKPVIPGSELKGCIRSVYETVTQSCFSVVNSNVLSSRISRPDNKIGSGLLVFEDDKWMLYSADKFQKGKLSKYNRKAEDGVKREWHKWGTNLNNTITYYFFKNSFVCEPDKADIQKFEELLDIFVLNSKASNKFLNILSGIKKDLHNHNSVPVFYKCGWDNHIEYLSPAQVSRKMFDNTVKELLGDHSPDKCGENSTYCPACRLFGSLGENPVASRVRFSDAAEYRNVRIKEEYCNLPELASPKITSVEFYSDFPSRGNNSKRWNYDDNGVQLKGRKYYFHSPAKSESELGPRSIATKPVLDDSEFIFDVYFDRITETEFRQFLWSLTLGENDADGNLMHKLGFGKPVGYGSIKITVDKITVRKNDGFNYCLTERKFDDYNITDELFSEKESVGQLKIISDYDFVSGKNVSYPIADNGKGNDNSTAAHQWFTSNRPQNGTFRFVLPKLSDNPADMELPAMTVGHFNSAESNNNSGSAPAYRSNKNFDDLQKNYRCNVQITEIREKNGQKYAYFKINGKTASVKAKYIPKEDCSVGRTISVTYKGLNDKGFPDFFVNRK